jgi:hypothetical protein
VLGGSEAIPYGYFWARDRFPFMPPHFPMTFLMAALSSSRSLLIGLMVFLPVALAGGGFALLTKHKIGIVLYCVIGGLVALADLGFSLLILFLGGGHVFSSDDALKMLLMALPYDVIPVSLSIWLVTRSRSACPASA